VSHFSLQIQKLQIQFACPLASSLLIIGRYRVTGGIMQIKKSFRNHSPIIFTISVVAAATLLLSGWSARAELSPGDSQYLFSADGKFYQEWSPADRTGNRRLVSSTPVINPNLYHVTTRDQAVRLMQSMFEDFDPNKDFNAQTPRRARNGGSVLFKFGATQCGGCIMDMKKMIKDQSGVTILEFLKEDQEADGRNPLWVSNLEAMLGRVSKQSLGLPGDSLDHHPEIEQWKKGAVEPATFPRYHAYGPGGRAIFPIRDNVLGGTLRSDVIPSLAKMNPDSTSAKNASLVAGLTHGEPAATPAVTPPPVKAPPAPTPVAAAPIRVEGKEVVYTDPDTGAEIARQKNHIIYTPSKGLIEYCDASGCSSPLPLKDLEPNALGAVVQIIQEAQTGQDKPEVVRALLNEPSFSKHLMSQLNSPKATKATKDLIAATVLGIGGLEIGDGRKKPEEILALLSEASSPNACVIAANGQPGTKAPDPAPQPNATPATPATPPVAQNPAPLPAAPSATPPQAAPSVPPPPAPEAPKTAVVDPAAAKTARLAKLDADISEKTKALEAAKGKIQVASFDAKTIDERETRLKKDKALIEKVLNDQRERKAKDMKNAQIYDDAIKPRETRLANIDAELKAITEWRQTSLQIAALQISRDLTAGNGVLGQIVGGLGRMGQAARTWLEKRVDASPDQRTPAVAGSAQEHAPEAEGD
jgi:hypothetical protein